jgi:hypothetical protein
MPRDGNFFRKYYDNLGISKFLKNYFSIAVTATVKVVKKGMVVIGVTSFIRMRVILIA